MHDEQLEWLCGSSKTRVPIWTPKQQGSYYKDAQDKDSRFIETAMSACPVTLHSSVTCLLVERYIMLQCAAVAILEAFSHGTIPQPREPEIASECERLSFPSGTVKSRTVE